MGELRHSHNILFGKNYRIKATRATRRRSEHEIEGNNEGGCVAMWSAFNVCIRASRNVCLGLINFGLIKGTECPNQMATSYNKTNSMHQIFKFMSGIKLYMSQTVPLSIIKIFPLYTQQWYMSYKFADSLRAGSRRNVLILLASSMIYTTAVCTVKNS